MNEFEARLDEINKLSLWVVENVVNEVLKRELGMYILERVKELTK
jgi:hypothetical protein